MDSIVLIISPLCSLYLSHSRRKCLVFSMSWSHLHVSVSASLPCRYRYSFRHEKLLFGPLNFVSPDLDGCLICEHGQTTGMMLYRVHLDVAVSHVCCHFSIWCCFTKLLVSEAVSSVGVLSSVALSAAALASSSAISFGINRPWPHTHVSLVAIPLSLRPLASCLQLVMMLQFS